jgi:hypothetical protein
LKNIEELVEEGKFDHEINKMTSIIEEACPHKTANNHWATDIISETGSNNDVDEEEEEEEEELGETIFDF